MRVEELEAINLSSREAIKKARALNIPVSPEVPYFGYVTVDIFDCPAFTMFTNNDSPTVSYILNAGKFEPQSMKLWCHLARTATGILDIGANVGVYGLSAASLRPDLAIHCFEPNPYACARLRMHKAINKAENLVEHPVAVGETNQFVEFSWVVKPDGAISSGGRVGTIDKGNTQKTVVSIVTLDSLSLVGTLGNAPLIKIDVEGSELLVFKGLKNVLALKPDIILETFSQKACDQINAGLLPAGYKVYKILESEGRLVAQESLHPCISGPPYDFNHLLTARPDAEFSPFM